MNIKELSASKILNDLRNKEYSVQELVKKYLDHCDKSKKLNAFVTLDHDKIMKAAKHCDDKYAKNTNSPLEGLPVAIKDLFCTQGEKTTACSKIIENFVPPYSSTVTQKLNQAGAISFGKTNMDEFAMGSSNETSVFGEVINPYSPEARKLSPGGSSGGSAAAVCGSLAPIAIGTDTGGSIRQPASLTGIVGIKPTYGRISRYGVVAFASSLDQAGVLSKNVEDSALLLKYMCGHDEKDSTCSNAPVPDFSLALNGSLKGKVIGIPKQYRVENMPKEIDELWKQGEQWLVDAGAEIKHIDLVHTKYALPVYYIVAPAEASSNLARYDGVRYGKRVEADNINDHYKLTRDKGFGEEVKRRIMIGTYVLSAGYYDAYYLKAQKVRKIIFDEFISAFHNVDLILTPTAPNGAFKLGSLVDDPITMYLNDIFTVTANLAGLPAISVPCGYSSDKLPLGLQLFAPPMQEEILFTGAAIMEKAADFVPSPTSWWHE